MIYHSRVRVLPAPPFRKNNMQIEEAKRNVIEATKAAFVEGVFYQHFLFGGLCRILEVSIGATPGTVKSWINNARKEAESVK